MICAWAPGATTGKAALAYAELTPILCSNPETKIASECLATNAVQHYGRQTVLLFSLASNRDEVQYGCFNRLVSLST